MKNALLNRKGEMGSALDCVINYQNGTWNSVEKMPLIDTGSLSQESITHAYLNSVKWVEENTNIH
jgi:c-di-GMP-related signal transduction protein